MNDITVFMKDFLEERGIWSANKDFVSNLLTKFYLKIFG